MRRRKNFIEFIGFYGISLFLLRSSRDRPSLTKQLVYSSPARAREFNDNIARERKTLTSRSRNLRPSSDVTSGAAWRTEVTCNQRAARRKLNTHQDAGGQWVPRRNSDEACCRAVSSPVPQSSRGRRGASVVFVSPRSDPANFLTNLLCIIIKKKNCARSRSFRSREEMACNRAAKSGFAAEAQRKVSFPREKGLVDPLFGGCAIIGIPATLT